MARYVVNVGPVALLATAVQTIAQLITGAKQAKLIEAHVSFNGISASDVPVVVDVLRQTTAGTATGAQVPLKDDPADGAALLTYAKTVTVEPTAGDILRSWYVTPNGGLFVLPLPVGGIVIPSGGGSGGRLSIRATAPANVSTIVDLVFEE